FHITDWKGKPITLALPIILWTDNGLTVFSSSRSDHDNSGQTVVEVNGERFVRYEENIFYADKFDKVAFDEKSVLSKPFSYELRPLDFSITKTVFSMLLSLVLLLLIFMSAARPYKKNNKAPKGISRFIEPLILFVRDDIAKPQLGNNSDKFMPILLTIFFFIWINNIIGIIPFFPFGGNVTGNIIFTFTMAIIVFLLTVFNGNKHYWGHILNPPVPFLLKFILAPIEV